MSLPCHFHDEAHCHTGVLVGTAEAVNNIKFLAGKFFYGEFLNGFPCFFGHGFVIVGIFFGCPPNVVAAVVVEHDEFVFG